MFISAWTTKHHAVFSTNKMSIQEKEVTALSTVLRILICHQLCMTNAGEEKSLQEEKSVRALQRQEGPSPQCLSPAPNFFRVLAFLDMSLDLCAFLWRRRGRREGAFASFPNNISARLRLTRQHLTSKDKQHHSSTMLKLDWMTTIPR